MENVYDCTLVSIYGRLNGLANQLKDYGLNICFIDLTDKMGKWLPEDKEGPFGVYKTESHSKYYPVSKYKNTQLIDRGFNLWLDDGPCELNGPLFEKHADKFQLSESVLTFLKDVMDLNTLKTSRWKRKRVRELLLNPYEKIWLAHLAMNLSANIYYDFPESLLKGVLPLPLQAPLFIRKGRGEQGGFVDELKTSSSLLAIEYNSSGSYLISGDDTLETFNIVWGLSSQETGYYSKDMLNYLFSGYSTENDWSWVRYRFTFQDNSVIVVWPDYFILLRNIYLPFTHSQFAIVQKTDKDNAFDIWVRISEHKRFNKKYLQQMGEDLKYELLRRVKNIPIVGVDFPQEGKSSYEALGPAPFGCYAESTLKQLKPLKQKGLFFDSPETWGRLDWNMRTLCHKDLFQRLSDIYNKRQEGSQK